MSIDKFDTSTKDIGDYNNWYQPHTKWKIPDRNWCKTHKKFSFDLDRIREDVLEIKETFGFKGFPIKGKKRRWAYQGIGLTTRPEASDPLYDALHTYNKDDEVCIDKFFVDQATYVKEDEKYARYTYEKNFTQRTDACTPYLSEILDRFSSTMCKARILELKPGGIIFPHVDFPYYEQVRLHAPIFSNEETFWEVNGERFQIPEDGNFYWFDTGKYHSVVNKGKESRFVLSINLSLYYDKDENPTNHEIDIDEFLSSDRL